MDFNDVRLQYESLREEIDDAVRKVLARHKVTWD